MNEKFVARMAEPQVRKDTVTLADFVQIYCDGHHDGRARVHITTDAAQLGVYGRKHPVLCAECAAHLAYAEKRRAYCPHDPKPFCAHCETHCYKPDERAWQQQMMRYSGPKSWRKGHAIDGIRHVLAGRRFKREMARRAQAQAPTREETRS